MRTFTLKGYPAFILVLILPDISCQTREPEDLKTEIQRIENGLLPSIVVRGDPDAHFSILERMEHYKVPGASLAVVEGGRLKWARGYGLARTTDGKEVDTGTLFQAGSISKPLAALAALKLVEEGKIDLDEDVNHYLTGWTIPENHHTSKEKVTLRRLLTHTAGMTVHGFPGYRQADSFPTLESVLEGKGNTPAILVDTIPGSIWRYSGGGYTVMEKMVEDVSGLPFETYLDEYILTPLGMDNSTYAQPLPEALHERASAAYDTEGELIEGLWHNYPEQSAAGLWTTPADLASFCIEIQEIMAGKPDGILKRETVERMLTKHKNDWGLGPSLGWEADSLSFGHGGKNAGFTNQMTAFAHRGDAVVIMTNADNGGELIAEVLRSVSEHYNWGISRPRMVDTVSLPVERLKHLTGRYKLDFQVPGIGDYLIGVELVDNRLYVTDPNDRDTVRLTAVNDSIFVDLEDSEEIRFRVPDDSISIGLLWDGRFQFYKVIE